MFIYKVVATFAAMALGVAAVIALSRLSSEVEAAPTATAASIATGLKSDRLDIRPISPGCLQDEWPYGCQWRPLTVRRVSLGAGGRDHQRAVRTKPSFAAKVRSARRARSVSLTSAPAL